MTTGMHNYFSALRSEIIKLKNSGVLWLASVGTVITNLIIALIAFNLTKYNDVAIDDPLANWKTWIQFHYDSVLPMMLPMFLVILCALSVLSENRMKMWKVLYTLPISKSMIFLSKFKVISLVYALSHLLFVLLMLIIPFLSNVSFLSQSVPIRTVLLLFVTTILSSLGILGLVYFTSYFSKSFVLPLAIGIVGFVIAQLMRDYNMENYFFPFSIPSLSIDSILTGNGISTFSYVNSLVLLTLFLVLGFRMADMDNSKVR